MYFDPKILRGGAEIPRAKNPFQEAVVFMVGGGNYIEYQVIRTYIIENYVNLICLYLFSQQNLLDYASGSGKLSGLTATASAANLSAAASSSLNSSISGNVGQVGNKRIIYGCTTLVNANQMMNQLAELGHEI